MVYFYSPTCLKCKEAVKAVDAAEEEFGQRIRIERMDISKQESMAMMSAMEDQCNSTEKDPPKIFVGKQYLAGVESIKKRLATVMEEELARGATTTQPVVAEGALVEKFKSFQTMAVVAAGLVDGINPCAFTTIVFLLSMLAYLGKTKSQIAAVGATFTAAVFATYVGIGIGLFYFIKVFAVNQGISLVLTYTIAGLAIVLGVWSFWDAIRYRRSGQVDKGTLGLPTSVKKGIDSVIRNGLKTKHLVLGAFRVGVLVSLLESLCTGQVYLQTIMLVLKDATLRLHAIAYLLLYNLMFILPLIIVVLVTYWGVGSDKLGGLIKKHLGTVKFLLAFMFLALGILLLATV